MIDELIFYTPLPEIKEAFHYDLGDASDMQVGYLLSKISDMVEHVGYAFSGINLKPIDSYITSKAKQYMDIISFIEKNASSINTVIKEACPEKEHKTIAESYFINRVLTYFGIPFKVLPAHFSNVKMPKEVHDIKIDDQIVFILHYNKMIAVKKLTVPKAERWEISAILASINFTAVNNTFKLLSKREPKVKKYRHSLTYVAEVIKESFNIQDNVEKALFISRSLEQMNYSPYLQPMVLVKAYPDVKPPKPRGRLPK